MNRKTSRLVVVGSAVVAASALGTGLGAAATSAARPWTIGLSTNRDSRDAEIYTVRSDGSGARRLTRSPFFDGFGAWSPDRRKIAFYSQRSAKGDVWVMNADGSVPRNLTSNLAHDSLGSWSPDGRRIAFDSDRAGGGIYVMNADGSGQRAVPGTGANDVNPQWAPDGKTILFVTRRDGNEELYAINLDGSDPRNLTNDPGQDGAGGLLWSPDGRRIAFTSRRDRNTEVYVMNADGSGQTRVTRSKEDETLLSWSPDGRRIAFQRYPSTPRWAFFVMNADGSAVKKVAWPLPRSG
jgi:Tol biopolymer transport system component